MNTVAIKKNGKLLVRAMNANRYFLRLRGLIGRELHEGEGLILTPCNSIHTFGMSYPIDAVYLDKTGVVLRVEQSLPRGKAWPGQRGARSVLELPAGTANTKGIYKGDRLEVV
jgi:uncharacterized membrane protein (UPF0127 family)